MTNMWSRFRLSFLAMAFLAAFSLLLAGCERSAGEKLDDAVDNVEDAFDDLTD